MLLEMEGVRLDFLGHKYVYVSFMEIITIFCENNWPFQWSNYYCFARMFLDN